MPNEPPCCPAEAIAVQYTMSRSKSELKLGINTSMALREPRWLLVVGGGEEILENGDTAISSRSRDYVRFGRIAIELWIS